MSRVVLSFGAHPDDIEIGCGGTEALRIRGGDRVVHAVLTSGEAGSLRLAPAEIARIREEEARQSARLLGVPQVEFLRYPDGLTAITRDMKIALIGLIRRLRPDTVFVHSTFDEFPDHRLVHRLVMDAIGAAAGPWYSEAGGEPPHLVSEVLGYEVWTPHPRFQKLVDISETLPLKLEALACHRSQLESVRYDTAVSGLASYRGALSPRGFCYAEAFEVISSC